MYEDITPITLKSSTSSLYNNLDVLPAKLGSTTAESSFRCAMYLSIHKYGVNIVQQNNASLTHRKVVAKESSSQHNTFLIDAKWCCLKNQTVLVIAHVRGFQIFDEMGDLLLFWHSTLERGVLSEGETAFCRGISCIGDTIFVGTCKGEILVVQLIDTKNFIVSQTINAHPCPVSTISVKKNLSTDDKVTLASADDEGSISLWKMIDEGNLKFIGNISGSKCPCTAVCLLNDGLLAASYYTGHIRIFDTSTQDMLAEIAAHGAPVNSMDCYLDTDCSIVLSGSEDTFVRVWKITRKGDLKITQEWSTQIKDLLIFGVKFHSTDGLFGVTGYDSDQIALFMKRT